MSARIIGQQFGKTAAEMNKLLAQYGYLEGAPGLWRLTEKGDEYAHEKHEHRGTGGSAQYNRDWTVTTYDDSIIDALRSDIATNPNPPAIDYSSPAEAAESAEQLNDAVAAHRSALSDTQKVLLVLSGIAVAAYGVKKLLPRAKRAWREHKDRKATNVEPADDSSTTLDQCPTDTPD